MPLIAKSSFQACLPPETTQYTHLVNSLSKQGSFATTYKVESNALNWFNAAFFPLISSDENADMIVLVYFSNNPIYVENAGVAKTSIEHYRGGWAGLDDQYDTLPHQHGVLRVNATFMTLDFNVVDKLIKDFSIQLPTGTSYLTFVPQRPLSEVEGDSWQLSVVGVLKGYACGLYSGSAYPGFTLRKAARKHALAIKYALSFYTMAPQAPKLAASEQNVAKYVPFGVINDPTATHVVCATGWDNMLLTQLTLLGSFRDIVAKQSVVTAGNLGSIRSENKEKGDEEYDAFIWRVYNLMYGQNKDEKLVQLAGPNGKFVDSDWLENNANSALETLKNQGKTARAQSLQDALNKVDQTYNDYTYSIHPSLFATVIHQIALANGVEVIPHVVKKSTVLTPEIIKQSNARTKEALGRPVIPQGVKNARKSAPIDPKTASRNAIAANEAAKSNVLSMLRARFQQRAPPAPLPSSERQTDNEDTDF